MPFSSKGFTQAHAIAANSAVDASGDWSGEGSLPVVLTPALAPTLLKAARPHLTPENQGRFDHLSCWDAIEFCTTDELLPQTDRTSAGQTRRLLQCAPSPRWGSLPSWKELRKRVVREVLIPASAGCCAFAGDRGFLFPN